MTTVFLSGSRNVGRLPEAIRARVDTIVDKGFDVVVGDAAGADKSFQRYLAELDYPNVVVYCSGHVCRNNIGRWAQKEIAVNERLSGREFYAVKDKAMAAMADYGLVLWDGKSAGSIGNVLELLKQGKAVVLYFSPDNAVHALRNASDVEKLMQRCDVRDYRTLNAKVHVERRLRDLDSAAQEAQHL